MDERDRGGSPEVRPCLRVSGETELHRKCFTRTSWTLPPSTPRPRRPLLCLDDRSQRAERLSVHGDVRPPRSRVKAGGGGRGGGTHPAPVERPGEVISCSQRKHRHRRLRTHLQLVQRRQDPPDLQRREDEAHRRRHTYIYIYIRYILY